MEYAVTRTGSSLVTLHEGTDTTARDAAVDQLADRLDSRSSERIDDWSITDATVYEHPSAPFDPYTVQVGFEVAVTVEATDAEAAERAGSAVIEETLAELELDAVSYTSSPAVSTG